MKEETRLRKMMEALGLADVHQATVAKKQNLNMPVAIDESKIDNFRAAQGLLYFLQAPELFTQKTCKHCGENFLVSRQYVACCSYTCIRKDLEARGFTWRGGNDIEALVQSDVYEGNEPLWVRNLDLVERALLVLSRSEQMSTSSPA